MNFAQLINRFYQDYGESNTNRFTIDLLKEWFDEAQRVINKETLSIKTYTASITAVNNQRAYSMPTDILDQNIDDVYYGIDSVNTDRPPLEFISLADLKAFDPYFETRNGQPTHWYIDEHESKYCLYPFELSIANTSGKIKLRYRAKHTKMTNYYSTGLATLTNASTAVTGSGTTFTGNVSVGDQIGAGKLLDLTRATSFPSIWGTVLTVDSTTGITLSSAYTGATSSGGSYIASSTSSFTDDELNLACVDYCIGLAFKKDKDFNSGESKIQMAIERAKRVQSSKEIGSIKAQAVMPSGMIPGSKIFMNRDYSENGVR